MIELAGQAFARVVPRVETFSFHLERNALREWVRSDRETIVPSSGFFRPIFETHFALVGRDAVEPKRGYTTARFVRALPFETTRRNASVLNPENIMSFQEYWQCRRRESFGKSRVITETVGFILFLACGLIRLKYPNFPIDQTIWWAMACVFFAALLIDICFVSPYRHADSLEHEHRDEVQKLKDELRALRKQIDDLVTQNNAPQPVLVATEQLTGLLARGDALIHKFQRSEAEPPTLGECVAWDDEVGACARQTVFEGIITPKEIARFRERWDYQDIKRFEAKLDLYEQIKHVDENGRAALRYVCGRAKRLEELIAHIEGKPTNLPLVVSYDQENPDHMWQVMFRDADGDKPATIVRLEIASSIPSDIVGCNGVLTRLVRNREVVVPNGNLQFRFTPAQDPNSDKCTIQYLRSGFLEIVKIPEGGEAEIMIGFPFADVEHARLDRSAKYSLYIVITADNAVGRKVFLDVEFTDSAWQFVLRQP
jgi:hypothetical protein